MAEFSEILFDIPEPHIARVTLNRPAQMNAYTTRLCEELVEAIDIYLRDDELRCLILTGAGRGFCSGGDISGADEHHAELMSSQLSHGREMRDGMHRVILALSRLDKPTIAMVNGPAVAGGLTLALSCDLRIAADTAQLGDTSGRGAWLFPRFMGLDLALKMTMLAEVYSAGEAEDLGLVTEVVPAAELEARVMELARELALRAPLAVRLSKSMMMRGQGMTLEQSLGDAALSVMIANPSADVREGVKAFFDKRMPKFTGR